MPKTATTRSEVLEQEYAQSVTLLVAGVITLVVALLVIYFGLKPTPHLPALVALGSIAALAAVGLFIFGALRMVQARQMPSLTVTCPYCEKPIQFLSMPTTDFDCEQCHRHVYYENGVMAPIMTITCAFCRTLHKVSTKATMYTCDKCNRPLRLVDDAVSQAAPAPVAAAASAEVPAPHDVILVSPGRNRNEVAMALEPLLHCTLVQVRSQLENLPLTITSGIPELKAHAIRSRLISLGAEVYVTPTIQPLVSGKEPSKPVA